MQEPAKIVRTLLQRSARPQLPIPPTPLIGREQEVQAVCALLQRPALRLLTLTGTAGVGKTRLAIAVAAELAEVFADGGHYIPLAVLTDPVLVLPTIAHSLGLHETAEHSMSELLRIALNEQQLLLVLDNFEQVMPAASHLADLLATCPHLKLLVTSREVLRLQAEQQFPLDPLVVPASLTHSMPDDPLLVQNPAVQLFVQRAQAAQPEFALTRDNALTIAEICRRLEGIPLAIELAAPRLKLLSPKALLARLEGRLQVLVEGARDLPERQQTMRATIQWSYDLLTSAEQALFRRMAVFVGGWTLAAAEAVCQAAGGLDLELLKGLSSLLDKSLLRQVQTSEGEIRFRMLYVLREFGLEQLEATDELAATCAAHAAFFLALAEEADSFMPGPQGKAWLDRLEQEHDNLRAALTWWIERAQGTGGPGSAEHALRLCCALGSFWLRQTAFREAQAFFERALAIRAGVAETLQAKALLVAAELLLHTGNVERAEPLLEEGVVLSRQVGDTEGLALALILRATAAKQRARYTLARASYEEAALLLEPLGNILQRGSCLTELAQFELIQGNYERARVLLEESVALFRALGNQPRIGLNLGYLGWTVCAVEGDLTRGAALAEQGLKLVRETGNRWFTASILYYLGEIRLRQGHLAQARLHLEEALEICQVQGAQFLILAIQTALASLLAQQGDMPAAQALYRATQGILPTTSYWEFVPGYLEGWAILEAKMGQPGRAARLWGAAESLREALGVPRLPIYQEEYTQAVATARTQLSQRAFEAAWEEGRGMTPEQALAALDRLPPPAVPATQTPPASSMPEGLTPREVEVLRLLAQGLTNREIAEHLVVSSFTIQTHLKSIYGKLGVTTRTAATRYALDHQLF